MPDGNFYKLVTSLDESLRSREMSGLAFVYGNLFSIKAQLSLKCKYIYIYIYKAGLSCLFSNYRQNNYRQQGCQARTQSGPKFKTKDWTRSQATFDVY